MAEDLTDFSTLRLFPIAQRRSLVSACSLRTHPVGEFAPDESLPTETCERLDLLARAIRKARARGHHVALGMGAHAIKLCLGPYLTDLIRGGMITSLAVNGAAAFHDLELAVFGETSEDVAEELPAGRFGFADEPSRIYNEAAIAGMREGIGLGAALSRAVFEHAAPDRREYSVLAVCHEQHIPLTVHISIGTDVAHIHPSADGAALGAGSFIDFRKFCARVSDLSAGVYVNLGSAVLLPEVFLKAVSVAINTGVVFDDVTTANLDMIDHYRPRQNVIGRIPGTGIDIRARHEHSLPYLHHAVLSGTGDSR